MPDVEIIKKEYDEILNQLSSPELISDWGKFEELSKKKKALEKIIERQKAIDELKNQIKENEAILKTEQEPELVSLAEGDIKNLREKEKILRKELDELLKEDNMPGGDFASVIIEIRAGTGGEEAALFASDLYKMYSKYAASQGWSQKILDSHTTGLGGFKEIIFEVKGENAYPKMKNEGGVHRVQRIPETEKVGRVHTSTATVAVLPKPNSKDIKIRPDQIKIDVYRASGPGGQNVNKRETAVRITHLPTGMVVASQSERNQLQNKENALAILSARLLEKKEQEEQSKTAGNRKIQIGAAKRAEKIRTYNFPQDRVTDHRIKKSWHNIEEIMEGRIDKIVEALQKIEN